MRRGGPRLPGRDASNLQPSYDAAKIPYVTLPSSPSATPGKPNSWPERQELPNGTHLQAASTIIFQNRLQGSRTG